MADEPPTRDLEAEFEAAYAAVPPWDIGEPQRRSRRSPLTVASGDSVLDVGCGTGEHVLLAAGAGCEAVGIDIAASVIRLAVKSSAGKLLRRTADKAEGGGVAREQGTGRGRLRPVRVEFDRGVGQTGRQTMACWMCSCGGSRDTTSQPVPWTSSRA